MNPKKHVIFIVLDTHRRDRLGCYGYQRPTSPNLDAFARDACVFENAISPAQWTIPSHASMFSGEYSNTHLTIQSSHSLDHTFPTLAEILRAQGYRNIGFCNNPLVGVIDNGLRRGFDTFYNYGGAVPSLPSRSDKLVISAFSSFWEWYTQLLRKISYPIQNAIARSDQFLKLSLIPALVPLWTRYAHFKGDTQRSIQDTVAYLRTNVQGSGIRPHFLFLNLMETHLPFTPPQEFVKSFASRLIEDRTAARFMRDYNTQALRWLLPMEVPFAEVESLILSELYDAEVAYQDHLLSSLLDVLDEPYHRENSLVIFVSDHGEMLGEHNFMGHSFRVFQELVHVPLMIRFPGQRGGVRITRPISTRQLFHTVLDHSDGFDAVRLDRPLVDRIAADIGRLSLINSYESKKTGPDMVIAEAFPPSNVLKIMEKVDPGLIEIFHTRAVFRGAFNDAKIKLVHGDGLEDRLYDLSNDPGESTPLSETDYSPEAVSLKSGLEYFLEFSVKRRPQKWTRKEVILDDEGLVQRMRDLGYMD
jgi:uncharacterized sulfatase